LEKGGYENEHEEYLANELNELNTLNNFTIGKELNTRNIEEIVKIMYNDDSEERKMLKNIFAMYKYYHNGKGKNLRNNTIIAHGFKGVNREMINEMLAKNGINKDIEKFFTEDIKNKFYKIIDEDVEENIFDKINSKIIGYLNKI
jgi:ribosomal protein L35AE/L33A